jgi:uncharacterized lipoprotein YehR (DUF1307 family)
MVGLLVMMKLIYFLNIYGIIDINISIVTKEDNKVIALSDVKQMVYDTFEIIKKEVAEKEIKKWFDNRLD